MDINQNLIKTVDLLLIKKEIHVRELSRFLKISPTTASSLLNKLYKNKVLDINIKGKNKVYNLNKNNLDLIAIVEKSRLLDLFKDFRIKKILDDVLKDLDLKFIHSLLVFGSYADFTSSKRSDLDLFFIIDNKKYVNNIKKTLMKIEKRYNKEINGKFILLKEFNKEDNLIKEIIDKHVIIYGVDNFLYLIR